MRKTEASCLLLLALGLAGSGPRCRGLGVDVRQYGEMRMVLRDGHTEPRIDLVEATQVPHAYGVGALAELEGEITIFDGSVWVARSSGGDLAMSGPAVVESDRATLLTLSFVRQWESVE